MDSEWFECANFRLLKVTVVVGCRMATKKAKNMPTSGNVRSKPSHPWSLYGIAHRFLVQLAPANHPSVDKILRNDRQSCAYDFYAIHLCIN
jgi:hypothetical protein